MSIACYKIIKIDLTYHLSIVGSVVECSPATRAARVRFPDDAKSFILSDLLPLTQLYHTYPLSQKSQKKK